MRESSKLVNNFTWKNVSNSRQNNEFKGQRLNQHDRNSSDQYYYFQLLANGDILETFQSNIKLEPVMNFRFHGNRSTFLSQHLALLYIDRHNLVNCLINHKLYEENMTEKPVSIYNYHFQ